MDSVMDSEMVREEVKTTTPGVNDVLCGRGNGATRHQGNVTFRRIVWEYREEYKNTKRRDKTQVAWKVVEEVSKLDPPGRFLDVTKDDDGYHFLATPARALEKVTQALREKGARPPKGYVPKRAEAPKWKERCAKRRAKYRKKKEEERVSITLASEVCSAKESGFRKSNAKASSDEATMIIDTSSSEFSKEVPVICLSEAGAAVSVPNSSERDDPSPGFDSKERNSVPKSIHETSNRYDQSAQPEDALPIIVSSLPVGSRGSSLRQGLSRKITRYSKPAQHNHSHGQQGRKRTMFRTAGVGAKRCVSIKHPEANEKQGAAHGKSRGRKSTHRTDDSLPDQQSRKLPPRASPELRNLPPHVAAFLSMINVRNHQESLVEDEMNAKPRNAEGSESINFAMQPLETSEKDDMSKVFDSMDMLSPFGQERGRSNGNDGFANVWDV